MPLFPFLDQQLLDFDSKKLKEPNYLLSNTSYVCHYNSV